MDKYSDLQGITLDQFKEKVINPENNHVLPYAQARMLIIEKLEEIEGKTYVFQSWAKNAPNNAGTKATKVWDSATSYSERIEKNPYRRPSLKSFPTTDPITISW